MPSLRTNRILPYVALAALIAVPAYLYGAAGKRAAAARNEARPAKTTRLIVGTITAFDPPRLTIKPRTAGGIDIVISPLTLAYRNVPWGPGELLEAGKAYDKMLKDRHVKNGDPIPPPPGEMNMIRMSPAALKVGMDIGVLSSVGSGDDGQPPTALIIRPLTEKEAATQEVPASFPF